MKRLPLLMVLVLIAGGAALLFKFNNQNSREPRQGRDATQMKSQNAPKASPELRPSVAEILGDLVETKSHEELSASAFGLSFSCTLRKGTRWDEMKERLEAGGWVIEGSAWTTNFRDSFDGRHTLFASTFGDRIMLTEVREP